MQNEPKSPKPEMIINYYTQRTYKDSHPLDLPENEPKQTQNEPKVKIGKIEPNPLFKKGLYQFLPLRTYKNEPKRTQNKPNSNPIRQLWEKPLPARKIYLQTPGAPIIHQFLDLFKEKTTIDDSNIYGVDEGNID